MGYRASDRERHPLLKVSTSDEGESRNDFQRDRDRILYAPSFRVMAGKTQVVSVAERGGFHNRLTHSLKVAQLGRRLSERLKGPYDVPCPDPDVVEAACLFHDIGHPPFGHAGEEELNTTYLELAYPKLTIEERKQAEGGFQANAQNLRIATCIEQRADDVNGLRLTRAVLDAAVKYPWVKGEKFTSKTDVPNLDTGRKWGIYSEDMDAYHWLMDGRDQEPDPWARPVEEQIMDWADDVTYAAHDLEDCYRSRLVPLDRVLGGEGSGDEALIQKVVRYMSEKHKRDSGEDLDTDEIREDLKKLGTVLSPMGYDDSIDSRREAARSTSTLISELISGVELRPRTPGGGQPLVRHQADLHVPEPNRRWVKILKSLIWCFVIDDPALASQQVGSRRIMRDLLTWTYADYSKLLPPTFLQLARESNNPLRSSCDFVASLDERRAISLHRRLAGIDGGSLRDWLF
jgi:dGTPase